MYELKYRTPPQWAQQVLANMNAFLLDHAACERKASGMAMSMVAHYPDKPDLVSAMIDLAIEELAHFKEVTKLLHERGIYEKKDTKDPYVNALKGYMSNGREAYFLDRLLMASVIEKRGLERFQLIADALPLGRFKKFYQAISQSEARHYELFYRLAQQYCGAGDGTENQVLANQTIASRLEEILVIEAMIVADLPDRPALH